MSRIPIIIDASTNKVVIGTITYDKTEGGTLIPPSAASHPSSPQAGEIYWNTTDNKIYRRNDGNTAWDEVEALSDDSHRELDQLVHDLDESYHAEWTYTGNKPTNYTIYTDGTKTTKIREFTYTWVGSNVTQEIQKQYDGTGTLLETLTLTYSYLGGKPTTESCTRSTP